MPLYTANAIVLRRLNFGETDRIVTLYTRERGKLSGIAKGARKAISRLSGSTETFVYGRFQLASGKNLEVITQVEVKASFPRIRADLHRSANASYIMEMVEKMVEEHDTNPEMFDLMLSTLYLMERPNHPEKITHMFELQFMKMLGYQPILDGCVRCRRVKRIRDSGFGIQGETGRQEDGKTRRSEDGETGGQALRYGPPFIAPTQGNRGDGEEGRQGGRNRGPEPPLTPPWQGGNVLFFSPSMGGLVCAECGPLPEDAIPITVQTVEVMSALTVADAHAVEVMDVPREVLDQMAHVMRWYIRYRSERELKSLEFLQSLRVEGGE
jgi:DNA repair protein RecO